MPASDSKSLRPSEMPYIFVPSARRDELLPAADERWTAVLVARGPSFGPLSSFSVA